MKVGRHEFFVVFFGQLKRNVKFASVKLHILMSGVVKKMLM